MPISVLTAHPLAERFFPLMDGEELQRLHDDVQAHGLHDPITLYENQILDGRNRYTVCAQLGIEPATVAFTGTEQEAAAFVMSKNRQRRHLTAAQKSLAEARYREFHQKDAQERHREASRKGGKTGGNGRRRKGGKNEESRGSANSRYPYHELNDKAIPRKGDGWARRAAQESGVSDNSINAAAKILRSGNEEVITQVETGTLSLHKAVQQISPEGKKAPGKKKSTQRQKSSAQTPQLSLVGSDPQKIRGAVRGDCLKSLQYHWHLAIREERHDFLLWVAGLPEYNARTHILQRPVPRFTVAYAAPEDLSTEADTVDQAQLAKEILDTVRLEATEG